MNADGLLRRGFAGAGPVLENTMIVTCVGDALRGTWKNGWRTMNQPVNFRFMPLNKTGNEVYTPCFPVKEPRG